MRAGFGSDSLNRDLLRRQDDAQGEQLVLYSCQHGYAHRAHAICDLQPKVVSDAFAKAKHQLGQGLRVQSSAA